jgi:AraC-like DNA-binding protein
MSIDRKCIPPFLLNLVIRVLEQQALPTQGLLQGLDLEEQDLADQDTRISFREALQVVSNAYHISGDEALGLTIAEAVNIADWGMMGYAVSSCGTLGEALQIGQRYNRAATRLTDNSIASEAGTYSHCCSPLYSAGELERFLVEEDLGGVVGMLHRYLGDEANPLEVHFTYPEPDYPDRYVSHFRCPLRFEQGRNRIIWDARQMSRAMPQRNPAATAMAVKHCEQLIAEDRDRGSMVDKVRSYLVQSPGHYPPIQEVSSAFNMSESSLRRTLKALDSSYQEILNDVRKKLAIEYLTTSSLKLEEVALLVGYSDLSNFRRAFRGWTGRPPMDYRRQSRKQHD